MDEQLNLAPCGYLSVADDGTILAINQTLLDWSGYQRDELCGKQIHLLLPAASQMFYQIYVFPLLKLEGKVEEVYLAVNAKGDESLPMLLNAVRRARNGVFVNDHVFVQMRRRSEYEQAILTAKREAEEAYRAVDQANAHLEVVRLTLESKQNELLEMNRKLEILATTDELTGLKNRRTFQDLLAESVAPGDQSPCPPVSLLLVDVDHFKRINDTLGHPEGDRILQAVAQILEAHSRQQDIVARYGGEEFSIILPNTDAACALKVAERLRRAVEDAPWERHAITVSVGAATSEAGDEPGSLVTRADRALYASKSMGRNRVTHANSLP